MKTKTKAQDSKIADKWAIYNGDCCELITEMPNDSLQMSIYSPPFVGLYIYSDSERDMGNSSNWDEFFDHYSFLIRDQLRATMPGRLSVVHCKDLPAYHNRDGYAGLMDFPGRIVQSHEQEGWRFHSRVTIWKCPVVERERTNNNGLLHKTVKRDRSQLRQGMADYLLVFRKDPTSDMLSDEPVGDSDGFEYYVGSGYGDPRTKGGHPSPHARKSLASDDSINIWRRYAEPVWWDVNQQDVLNSKIARDDKDEKHICPLQLDVIERSIHIWSNPGDVIFSPFAGIGSEGVGALRQGRKFVGVELKRAYYEKAIGNLQSAENEGQSELLFS